MASITFKPRLYQEAIFSNSTIYNSLVVLPTGMGKTAIAIMLAIHRLNNYPDKKILMLAPTKPLVEQHYRSFKAQTDIDTDKMVIFTGATPPDKRKALWPEKQIIFATPQGIENDIINRNIDLKDLSLIIFDEAHRATGNYSYVWVAKQFEKQSNSFKVLALTASPGHDLETIREVTNNLFIEKIDLRTLNDRDVEEYAQQVDIKWLNVDLPPEYTNTLTNLKHLLSKKLKQVKYYGYLSSIKMTKSQLLKFQASLQKEIASKGFDEALLKSISLAAEALKIEHSIELLETQGITPLRNYFQDLITRSHNTKNKSIINLTGDFDFKKIVNLVENMYEADVQHPKMNQLLMLMDEIYDKDKKYIIFSQYRDTGNKLVETINDYYKDIKSKLFIGQAKKRQKGLSQKDQIKMLDEFRNNEFNILVSSSVGEEGLDIPKVDYVIFYEPVPSAIRTIQRRGRTGRNEEGTIYVLVAKSTRDEAYKWAAIHKEKKMFNILKKLEQSELRVKLMNKPITKDSKSLTSFIKDECKQEPCQEKYYSEEQTSEKLDKVKILVDYREKNSQIVKHLIDEDTHVKLNTLNIGDYLLSKDVVVEYKTDVDFVNSIVDGRLLNQLKLLKQAYKKPVVIVEGNRDIYSIRNIHANSIRGILATITVSYNIPILFTINSKDTAMMMKIIAQREQQNSSKEFSEHFEKPVKDIKQMQEYVVSALPGIGMTLAKPLLKEFKTIKNISNALENDLTKLDKIGNIKAKNLFDLFNTEYKE